MRFEVGDIVKGKWHGKHCTITAFASNNKFVDSDGFVRPCENYILLDRPDNIDPVLDYKIALAEELAKKHKWYLNAESYKKKSPLYYEIYCMAALMSGVFEGE